MTYSYPSRTAHVVPKTGVSLLACHSNVCRRSSESCSRVFRMLLYIELGDISSDMCLYIEPSGFRTFSSDDHDAYRQTSMITAALN